MGSKRPFFGEEFEELPSKHLKQLDSLNQFPQSEALVPSHTTPLKPDTLGDDEEGCCKSLGEGTLEEDTIGVESNFVKKDFKTTSGEEDARSGATTQSSVSQDYFELESPHRAFTPYEEASYSLLINHPPRKQVPLGPNHQANIPKCIRFGTEIKSGLSDTPNPVSLVDEEKKLMGTCIIPMPDSDSFEKAGEGRIDCCCLDKGSIRCVRQHVMESREMLMDCVGYDTFKELGFFDMGEEVAHKWTDEEEKLFQWVVYSNPFSRDMNFWKHLEAAFPHRSKKEIISYYFNVFILQRRAVQNRSHFLDIDSDDDEWHGSYSTSFEVRGQDEYGYSSIGSPINNNIHSDHRIRLTDEDEDDEDSDDDDSDGDTTDGDDGDGVRKEASGDMTDGDATDNASNLNPANTLNNYSFDSDIIPSGNRMSGGAGDDSCMSFEFQSSMSDLGKFSRNKLDGCSSDTTMAQVNTFEPCDAKVWDASYRTDSLLGVDFLPTCYILKEIFGQGQEFWDDKH